jgi:simple sugar transport system substrate-binding protein
VATTNSFDGTIYARSGIGHTGQDATAAAIGGEALARCVLASGAKGGSIVFPNTTTLGNVEVNNRITAAFTATVAVLAVAGQLGNFKVDAGPTNIGIDVDANNIVGSIVSLIESRGDVVGIMGANGFVTPAIGDAVAQLKIGDKVCAYGFDLGPKQKEHIKNGNLDGALGQQPFLQGFWPVMQLYLQIDRGIAAANLDTRAQLVTKKDVDRVGNRFEN